MIQFITLNLLTYLSVLLLTLLFIVICKKGNCNFGSRLQNFCNTSSLYELLFLIIVVSFIIHLTIDLLMLISNQFVTDNRIDILCMNPSNNNESDPVRWWPSGLPQTWGIIGTAMLVYKSISGNPKTKAMSALATLGVTIPANVYFYAVENPNGFNRLMYSLMTYKETGKWPANVPTSVSSADLKLVEQKCAAEQLSQNIQTNSNSFLPTGPSNLNDYINPENILNYILKFFRPVQVEGHLDDLIGQQLFIQFLILIVIISVIVLFMIYIALQLMVSNKDFILSKFNNRFILFYIKYQFFLSKIGLVVLPSLIFLGLIEILVANYFIVTHPIPYECLPIDLHIYLKKFK